MRVYPSDFDKVDRKMAKDITPDDVFITDMIVMVRWMDSEGMDHWRCYNATREGTTSMKIGLLELGKFDLATRSPSVFPVHKVEDDSGE